MHTANLTPSLDLFGLNELLVNRSDVLSELNRINTEMLLGQDGLHNKCSKELASVIAGLVSGILKKWLETRILLEDLKCVNISRIIRKVANHLPMNYRLFSLTEVLIKVLKRLPKKVYTICLSL